MYVIGTLAKQYNYVQPSDLVPGCAQGGPQYVKRKERKKVGCDINIIAS